MRASRSRMANLSPVVAGVAVLGLMAAREIASADWFSALLIAVVAFSGLALLNPRMGPYGFCLTLVLVPFDWRAGMADVRLPLVTQPAGMEREAVSRVAVAGGHRYRSGA